jgi:dihydrofolate reductase
MNEPRISAVVAVSKQTRAIGNNNKLLWNIPEDLKRFKKITIGHPVIMGRKTFESILAILGKPLPGRKNIVITRQKDYDGRGADIVESLEAGLAVAKQTDTQEIFIGGGQQIYEQALPNIDRLYLTLIDSEVVGDTFFPEYIKLFTKEIEREEREYNGLHYTWITLEK